MAKEVIQRGGRHESFRPEKLKRSIRKACKAARISAVRAKRIVAKVSGPVLRFARKSKVVRTAVLRKKVLAGLRKAEPVAAKAWLRYERRRQARRRH